MVRHPYGFCRAHQRRASSRAWRKRREESMATTGGRCARCGAPATTVHHRDPVRHGHDEVAPVDRLIPLCDRCHGNADVDAARDVG